MYQQFFKMFFDRVLAFVLLIVLSPLLVVTAILVRLFLGAPILFRQQRPGRDEKPFWMYKFRTMTDRRDCNNQLLPDSDRLNAFGRLLRSLSIDELPELFNILRGEMSFVGPRPLLMDYLPHYSSEQRRRHMVRPGLTGWAQVNGRNAIGWSRRFELDVWYVEHVSFRLDMKIFFLTALKVVRRDGISHAGEATMTRFDEEIAKQMSGEENVYQSQSQS
ncbi:sugar transferase [Legionella geestiana]|uniref:sugar transferase n=1 Tax=Legionella geestiana TaxID=45065 RepID=UPI0010928378|nr:sugar transferase [Legionella geestiana]QDQ40009.1 sugar transferase [Legionella geestiana]